MIVLTRREVCRRAMLQVIADTSSSRLSQRLDRGVVFVTSFAEAHRAPSDPTTCVVDLGSMSGSGTDVIASVHRLLESRPWLGFVLLAAHTNPELEAEVIHGLRNLPRLSLVQPRELQDVERWKSLLQDQFVERHAVMIEADLRGACAADQARLFEDPEVKRLLRGALRIRKVEELSAHAGSQRVGVWRRFKRLWGRSPSEMLSLLRVLWAAHLRHHRHSSADIASVLGFRDTEHCARRLGARLGLRKSDINALSYREIVAAVATCLVQQAPVSMFVARVGAVLKRAARASALLMVAWAGGVDADGDFDLLKRVALELEHAGEGWPPSLPEGAVG
jgi:AraC-like DNA-binding protein